MFWVNKKSFVSGIVDSSCEINVLSGGQNTKMKRWRVKIISLCLLCLISLVGCSFVDDKGDYMPCLKLKRGKTVNIEMAPGWHVSCSADEQAQKMKDEKRCVDAWVNEDGHCVVKLNRKQLKAEYDNVVDIMQETIKSSNEPVEVNYACNEIIYYANDTSGLSDFTYTFIVLPECCTAVQAYSGIPFDELWVTIKFIYQPTGEVMFSLQVSADNPTALITAKEFEEKLKEMKQGEHK